jgi:hypothetical protein
MFIPVVVVKNAVLYHDYFSISAVHERNRSSPYDSSQDAVGESVSLGETDNVGDGPAPWKRNVVYAHPGICNALAADFHCFQDTGETDPYFWKGKTGGASNTNGRGTIGWTADDYKTCDSLDTEPIGEEYPCHIFERDAVVLCSSDGLIELTRKNYSDEAEIRADTITAGNFDAGLGIKCYRFITPAPVEYLDGFGIAAGLVALFVYMFDLLDRIFDIGKPEPASKSKWKRMYFLWFILSFSIGLTMYTLYYCIQAATKNRISSLTAYADYFIPALCIEIWMIWFTVYVRKYDGYTFLPDFYGLCCCCQSVGQHRADRFSIIESLFNTYASDGTSSGYWTPESTVRLESQLKPSISFPYPDKLKRLDGDELLDCTAVAWFDRIDTNADGRISKEELVARLKPDFRLRKQLEDVGIPTNTHVFEQIDTNEDGIISSEELKVAFAGNETYSTKMEAMNKGILAFVAAIKRVPAKNVVYGNKNVPAGSLTFEAVWTASWDHLLMDSDLKDCLGQHWWELGWDQNTGMQGVTNTAATEAVAVDAASFGF